jgi:flagellar hook-associated protein 3 FlgL
MDRVSTKSFSAISIEYMTTNISDLAKVQKQISSGQAADRFEELSENGQIERVLNLNDRLKKIEGYVTNNKTVIGRINATDSAVEKIVQSMSQLRDTLTLKRSSAGKSLPIGEIARATIANVVDSLNLRYEGRYLFSGSRTNIPAVNDDILGHSNIINDQISANYYQGDEFVMSIQASDTLSLDYGVKANETAFQNVFAALHQSIETDGTLDDTIIAKAIDFTNNSIEQLTQIRARLNNNNVILNATNDSHDDLKIYFSEVVGDITATDIPEATIRAASHQTTLQAIFQTYARISRLTIADYLN